MRLQILRREDGIALLMVLGILLVLMTASTTAVFYTTANSRSADLSKTDASSFSLSEAALNNAMAVLSNPTNNSLDPDLLPASEAAASAVSYEHGTVKWWGVLDRATAVWTVTGLGLSNNPTGPEAAQVRRALTAKVPIVPTETQPLTNPSWNYIYATHTGSACDETLNNNVSGSSRMYVVGNLCLDNNAGFTATSLIVQGNLNLDNNAHVGVNTNMSTRVETSVGGNCRYEGGAWAACSGNQDARRIYGKLSDGTTVGVNHTPPVIAAPVADWATWYQNSIPGPSQSCTTTSGTPPIFDADYPNRNNSVAGAFDLTPSSSYVCRVGPGASTTNPGILNASQTTIAVSSASGFPSTPHRIRVDDEQMNVVAGFGTTLWTVTRGVNGTVAAAHVASSSIHWDGARTSGDLSWNATARSLTVRGTIFIDGSATVSGGTSTYNGQASLYLSGTFQVNGQLCGAVSGSSCAFAAWDPNAEMLTVVADSIHVSNNNAFQGALFATGNVAYGNNAHSDGPIMGSEIILSNNVNTDAFPTITTVPVAMPGNPAVYAQPNPPQMFAG